MEKITEKEATPTLVAVADSMIEKIDAVLARNERAIDALNLDADVRREARKLTYLDEDDSLDLDPLPSRVVVELNQRPPLFVHGTGSQWVPRERKAA